MTRAAWSRWSDTEIAHLRARAGDATAEDLAAELGRTLQQVRGAVKRHGVVLKPSPKLRARTGRRQAAGVARAWADPVKRKAMLSGIAERPLAGAAVAGTDRRHGGGWGVYSGWGVEDRGRLQAEPIFARAAALAGRLGVDLREDAVSELILAELEGRSLDLSAAARVARGPFARAVSLDAPRPGRRSGVYGDTIASDVEHV